jgi:GNAT superfamily N-acetyltransferase
MFVSTATAQRIEQAETETTRAMATALVGSARAPGAFVRALGRGCAAFVRPGSPMNKVIGVGLDALLDEAELAAVEQALRQAGEPVRVELATLALPDVARQLSARGYQLLGFENVLVRPLAVAPALRPDGVRITQVDDAATTQAWRHALVDGFAHSDDSGVPADQYALEVINTVIDDVLAAPDFDRYLAYRDGVLAGAASMRLHDGIAVLTGSATLPDHRRRGVQAALIAQRLDDARARGAELAIITTSPGTQSQANVMKRGFSLAYARALLVTPAS